MVQLLLSEKKVGNVAFLAAWGLALHLCMNWGPFFLLYRVNNVKETPAI